MKRINRFAKLLSMGTASGFFAIAISAQTDLYVTNYVRNNVLRYDADTGKLLNAIAGGGLQNAVDLAFGPDDHLYVACTGIASVKRFDGVTGAFLGNVIEDHAGGLIHGGWIAFAPGDILLVGDNDDTLTSKGILKFNRITGEYLGVFVSHGDHGMSNPDGMAIAPDGNLFVRSGPTNDLVKYDGSTGAYLGVAVPAATGGSHFGHGIAFDTFGRIFLSDQVNQRIPYFDPNTGSFLGNAVPPGAPANLTEPTGITFSTSGHLYVSDWGSSNSIKQFDGTTFAYTGSFENGSFCSGPFMIALHPRPSGVPITGHVEFLDYSGDVAGQSVEVRIQDALLGAGGETRTVMLDANGDFATTTTIRMRAAVSVKGSHWLRRRVITADIPAGGLSGINAVLTNGDVNGDNVIDLTDYTGVVTDFNSIVGDPNYHTSTDLNGDGVIDLTDYTILVTQFNGVGD